MPAPAAADRSAVDIEALVQAFAVASYRADGYATATHAGVAAVLEALADAARHQAAAAVHHYDHRSLYTFAIALDHASKPA